MEELLREYLPILIFLGLAIALGVVLILGGLRFATMEVEIYRQAVTLFNLPAAALLSLVQMGLTRPAAARGRLWRP